MAYRYVRYQRPTPNARGHHTGIFGLVNGLAHAGALSSAEWAFWRKHNDWYEANLTYPDSRVYDRAVNPLAAAWFKASAVAFLAPIPGYLAILRAHGVDCVEVRSDDPGIVVYEDTQQIVVVLRRPAEAAEPPTESGWSLAGEGPAVADHARRRRRRLDDADVSTARSAISSGTLRDVGVSDALRR